MISIPTAVHVKHLSQYTVKLLQNCQINLMSPVTILQIILESASWRVSITRVGFGIIHFLSRISCTTKKMTPQF